MQIMITNINEMDVKSDYPSCQKEYNWGGAGK